MKKGHPATSRYLRKLSKELAHLSQTDRDDITREIEEHILERWETDSGGAFDDDSLQGVLGKMGSPEYLAGQYCGQRGWARPPEKHTLRNATLATVAAAILLCVAGGYLSMKYIFSPFMGLFSGSIVEVDDDGVRILNNAISVTDEGVKIRGILNINASDDGVEISGSIKGRDILKLMMEAPLVEENGEFSVPADNATKVDLDFKYGRIDMKGTDTNKVSVTFVKKVYGDDESMARKILSRMEIRQKIDGGTIHIEGVNPLSEQKRYPKGIDGIAYEVAIVVPKGMAADVDSKYCIMNIESIKGPLDAEAKYGSMKIADIGGNASIDGKYSAIDARRITDDVLVDGKYGSMDLKDIGGNLSLDNKYGATTVNDVKGNIEAEAKYGQMKIEGVSGDMEIESKYGDIDVVLAESYGFKFNGQTKYGSINCDFPTKKKDKFMTATVGDGKHNLVVLSKYGSVNIKK